MTKHNASGSDRLVRSRWAAIGAAVAVSLGGGGLLIADASSGGSESSTVAVDPVRILDTRDPVNVGLSGPFVSAVSQKLQVTGSVPTTTGAQTVVPTGATGVLLNVTATGATVNGFISIRPGNATGVPATSSLNVTAGVTLPNAVTVALPTSGPNAGKIDITFDAYGVAGPVTEILIDVVGYITDNKLNQIVLGTAVIPSGQTVTGVVVWDHSIVGDNQDFGMSVHFPVGRAPAPLTFDVVNFASGPNATDDDVTCTGAASAPTAPPGKVCIYESSSSGVDSLEGYALPELADTGFTVYGFSNGAPGGDMYVEFIWAYTAP